MVPPELVKQMEKLVHDAGLDYVLDAFLLAERRRWKELDAPAKRLAWRSRATLDIAQAWNEV